MPVLYSNNKIKVQSLSTNPMQTESQKMFHHEQNIYSIRVFILLKP